MKKDKTNNIMMGLIGLVFLVSVGFVFWSFIHEDEVNTNNYVDQYIEGNMYRAYEDGTILKMS